LHVLGVAEAGLHLAEFEVSVRRFDEKGRFPADPEDGRDEDGGDVLDDPEGEDKVGGDPGPEPLVGSREGRGCPNSC
jgi:hypothetical protein